MDAEPDLAALRALTMIAEHGSISAASHHLGLSQQALSLRVRALESHLHVRLLARSPRGSHLTPSGELVVGWARAVLSAAEDFTQALTSLHNSRDNTLSIMASLTIAEHLLPEWIARWRGQLGDDGTVAKLTAANSTTVIAAVNEGTVDLGFIETPTIPADLGSVTVGHDTIEVVTSTSHPWAQTENDLQRKARPHPAGSPRIGFRYPPRPRRILPRASRQSTHGRARRRDPHNPRGTAVPSWRTRPPERSALWPSPRMSSPAASLASTFVA